MALAALLLAILTTACNSGSDRVTPEINTAVAKMRTDYIAAWKSGQADRVASQYTNDGVLLYPNQPVINGTAAIRDHYKKLFDEFMPVNFEVLSDEVIAAGNWAIDRGKYKITLNPKQGGATILDEGKYLVVLYKQPDGSFKIARDIDNSSMPLPPAAEEGKTRQ